MMQEEILSYMNKKQFEVSKIPRHEHNGIDTTRIKENDLLPTDNFTASLVMGNAGIDVYASAIFCLA